MRRMNNVTQLAWILDFAQTEWGGLSKEQKDIINVRLSHLHDTVFQPPLDFEGEETFSEEEIISIQNQIKEFLFRKLPGLPEMEPSGGVYCDLPPIGRALINSDGHYEIRRLPPDVYKFSEEMKSFKKMSREEVFARAMIDYVAESLISLPKDPIKRCEECQKLFLHLSEKKKIYCSSACSWKRLSRLRREALKENPKAYKTYLKKQREAMRKIYEKRRRAESGGKVRRRRKEG